VSSKPGAGQGAAALKPTPTEISAKWKAPEGILDAEIKVDSLTLTGAFERPSNPFAGLGLSLGLPAIAPTIVTHTMTFVGKIRGNIVIGELKRTNDRDASILGQAMNSGSVLMFFNEDHSKLSVMEKPQSSTPTFYTLARASGV